MTSLCDLIMWFEWAMVAVGLVLTVGTGFFVASEFALVNLDRQRSGGAAQAARRDAARR